MSATTPTSEPVKFTAGDTVSFTKSLSDYSAADGWALTYAFRGFGLTAKDFGPSTADGSDHLVEITAAQSAGLVPGRYSVGGYAILADERYEIYRGFITVEKNLMTVTEGEDTRTVARRILDNLNAVIEKKASHDILNSSVEGTTIGRLTPEQLFLFRDRYAAIVAEEEAAGAGRSRAIFTTFTRPR